MKFTEVSISLICNSKLTMFVARLVHTLRELQQ